MMLMVCHNLLYFVFIYPLKVKTPTDMGFSPYQFILFSVCAALVASAGNLINDYFDYEQDAELQHKVQLDHKAHYLFSYYALFAVACVLSFSLSPLMGSFLCVSSFSLLFLYSAKFKSSILIGNLLIALLTAFSILLIPIIEWPFLKSLSGELRQAAYIAQVHLGFLALSAFLTNFAREIIKDMEDASLDKRYKVRTFANTTKVAYVKLLISITLVIQLITLGIWTIIMHKEIALITLGIVSFILLISISILVFNVFRAQKPEDFKKPAYISKRIMMVAILSVILMHVWN